MKRFSRGQEKKENQSKEKVINQTTQEIIDIIKSKNYQWENFNKAIWYIENIIVWVLENDLKLCGLKKDIYTKELWLALMMPRFMTDDYFNRQLEKHNPELEDLYNKNQVTRVSTDSLRVRIVLEALGEILKISSAEEFWDKNYKIWNIEINSFEDLEQHRVELQKMREDFENYEIPGYKEAVQYAAENNINTNFYS